MTWNYRVCSEKVVEQEDDRIYSIREVYYDGDAIVSWSTAPTHLGGYETADDATQDATLMARASASPVVDLDAERARMEGLTSRG